ncbi:leucine-rich repeat-containing serine/threonine-protein kinase [Variovorax paradoxus]|uniref:leucine-rich repeat-containing protein kinase family protein n=1 Tax=Variovorax paradoxus TaxID=34073 RepID=UPI0021AD035A|nr:leucine-rich repeat-containing protein kinase family protein [Variovorax paradoxus]UVH58184.1 leucine-rich repeat-containing serine/threonine-protein kinase [Variovorax paradoxus]
MEDTLAQLRAGRLAGAKRIDLSCGLTEFPRELFDLADSLEVLNLSGNALDTLPDDLNRLHRLRVLFCSDNRFTTLPESIGRCHGIDIVGFKANQISVVPAAALPASLRWLILTDNQIEELPDSLGDCTRMQKLMLAGNRLRTLPQSMAALKQLELLRISANRFETLPAWLPSLPRLSWLACAGNPFDTQAEDAAITAQSVPHIDWRELTLGRKLGEGASGVIHQATLGKAQQVAVKLFKGAVTSDGWPHSEMAACIAAGVHPTLIAAQSRIDGHPDGTEGLVMALVDPSFVTLAGPPSLASCTRDVYAEEARWTPNVALRIARDIASAMQHLHARGILHGDLYAHNILWHAQRGGRLGDFGAAWMTGALDAAQARAFQALEMRAFGCLLEELLERCTDAAPASVSTLKDRCLQPDAAARPTFAQALSLLQQASSSP